MPPPYPDPNDDNIQPEGDAPDFLADVPEKAIPSKYTGPDEPRDSREEYDDPDRFAEINEELHALIRTDRSGKSSQSNRPDHFRR